MAGSPGKNEPDFNIVRLALYPIHEPNNPDCRGLVARCRAKLTATGCCSLPGFLTPDGLAEMTALSERAARDAHISRIRTNVYFTKDDETLPPDHPKRRFMDRTSAFVPADCIPAGSVQRRIYDWSAFMPFLATCLGERSTGVTLATIRVSSLATVLARTIHEA